jgi:hypothetical protein
VRERLRALLTGQRAKRKLRRHIRQPGAFHTMVTIENL